MVSRVRGSVVDMKRGSALFLLMIVAAVVATEPNPPVWPSSVKVLDPANPLEAQLEIERAYLPNGGHRPPFDVSLSTSLRL